MLRDRVTHRPGEARIAAEVIALRALAHVMADETLAERFLALSGLDAAALRARAGEAAVLAAVIDFLAGHDSDLVACARALAIEPAALAATARQLKG